MSSAYTLLSVFAILMGAVFVMFAVRWIEQGITWVKRRRRASQPRTVCRVRTQ